MAFTGFPVAALDFYDDLEVDNTRSFWADHKHVYEEAVRGPMEDLLTALVPEFAPDGRSGKIFRPYRDVRFAKDKTPYKTQQGAFVQVAESTGWYVEVSPRGIRAGGGFYHADGPRLAALRAAIDHDTYGSDLERILRSLRRKDFVIGGEVLKTRPRGYPLDHARIELLRHKWIFASHEYGFDPVIHTGDLLERIRLDWRATRPLVDWAERHGTH